MESQRSRDESQDHLDASQSLCDALTMTRRRPVLELDANNSSCRPGPCDGVPGRWDLCVDEVFC